MSIWQFQKALALRLLTWAFASMASGVWLLRLSQFWRGIGSQFVGWGVINALIAFLGSSSAERRMRTHPQALEPEFMDNETRNLSRLLWLNTFLDVLYMIGGLSWASSRKNQNFQRGIGWGIVVQGAFILRAEAEKKEGGAEHHHH